MKNLLPLLLLAACADPALSASTDDLASAPACAAPPPGAYDLASLQGILDANGCTELAPGPYVIATPPLVDAKGHRRPIAMLTLKDHQTLRGAGAATVLAFTGDVGGSDWYGVLLTGASPTLADLEIDTTGLSNTSEQTHAIQVSGPASAVAIPGVTFLHATQGPSGGDCIKVVGYASSPKGPEMVSGLTVDRDVFLSCMRGGVGAHSGLTGLIVSSSSFLGVRKPDIASEDGVDKSNWTIANNVFLSPGGDSALVLDSTSEVSVTSDVFLGRGIFGYDATDVTVTGTTVIKSSGSLANVRMEKSSQRVQLAGDVLVRPAGAPQGPVIDLEHHTTGYPSHVTVASSALSQQTEGSVLAIGTATDVSFVNNDVDQATIAGTGFAISVTGVIAKTDRLLVEGDRFTAGAALAPVRLSGSYTGIGRVSVVGNMASGYTQGLRCENAAGIAGPLVSGLNNWSPNVCAATVTAGY